MTGHGEPLSQKVIDYFDTTARLVKRAKQPDFSQEEWDELAALIAVDAYERVAANKGSRNWREDVALRSQWSGMIDFDTEIRRVKEVGNLVYVDLVETITANGKTNKVNTLGVFEFDAAAKISRLLTYQQAEQEPAA